MKTIWVDAQISPKIAKFITERFHIESYSLEYLQMLSFEDEHVFFKAKASDAIMLTKDSDFAELSRVHGSPPKIIWLTCGNTTNNYVKKILTENLLRMITSLEGEDNLVEISD